MQIIYTSHENKICEYVRAFFLSVVRKCFPLIAHAVLVCII